MMEASSAKVSTSISVKVRPRLGSEKKKISAHKSIPMRRKQMTSKVPVRRKKVFSLKIEESSSEETFSKRLKSSGSEEKDLPKRKPLKICGVKERTRIGVVAATLEELRSKIRTQFAFKIRNDFKIVLEEDCTKVEEEDYFQTLKDDTVLVAVSEGEQWSGASSSLDLEAEFSMGFVEVDGKMTQEETSQRLAQVAGRIAENPAVLAFLRQDDLEVISDADLNELQVLLHGTKDNAEFIQDACERRLTDKIASDEARELLKLYHRAKTEKGGSPKKDTRTSPRKSTQVPL